MGLPRRTDRSKGEVVTLYLASLLPILQWLPKYSLAKVRRTHRNHYKSTVEGGNEGKWGHVEG
jgi:hypothetical protein